MAATWSTAPAGWANVYINRTFRLRCAEGRAAEFEDPDSGLFGYVQAPTDFFSNSDGTYLHSTLPGEHLVTEFLALDHLNDATVGFKATAREWLPGHVATTRSVEVETAPPASFELAGPYDRPDTGIVQPPAPFRGEATFTRALGSLTGDLTISFLGKELPLAGPGSEAGICARPDFGVGWNCK